jgi:hypothetical protein
MATPPPPLPKISPEAPGAPPAKKSQNVLVWILGGCGTVLVLLILVGVLAFRSFMKNNVHIGPNGEVDMKMGGMTMHAGKPKDLGIPVYPGVEAMGAVGMDMMVPIANQQPLSLTVAQYNTKDSQKMLDDWYRQNLGPEFTRFEAGQKPTVASGKAFPLPIDRGAIAYTCTRDDIQFAVTINSIFGHTQLKLMRTNTPDTTGKPQ